MPYNHSQQAVLKCLQGSSTSRTSLSSPLHGSQTVSILPCCGKMLSPRTALLSREAHEATEDYKRQPCQHSCLTMYKAIMAHCLALIGKNGVFLSKRVMCTTPHCKEGWGSDGSESHTMYKGHQGPYITFWLKAQDMRQTISDTTCTSSYQVSCGCPPQRGRI